MSSKGVGLKNLKLKVKSIWGKSLKLLCFSFIFLSTMLIFNQSSEEHKFLMQENWIAQREMMEWILEEKKRAKKWASLRMLRKETTGGNETSSVSISFNTSNVDEDCKNEDVQSHTEPLSSSASIFSLGFEMQRNQADPKMNILRSPSRESVGTDISLFSVSTLASELTSRVRLLNVRTCNDRSRGPSPNFDSKRSKRPENIRELWFEDAYDMIKGMAALSSAVGLAKSFSTSDITNLPYMMIEDESGTLDLSRRNAVSEPAISSCQRSAYLLQQNMRLDNASRSCSTWVAVGDVSSTSQLPSPHAVSTVPGSQGGDSKSPYGPSFSPADLVRSVNKKVRQHYIRRRLLNTYKALERLSQSEFNLDKLEVEAAASAHGQNQSRMSAIDSTRGSTACESVSPTAVSCRKANNGGGAASSSTTTNRLSVPGMGSVAAAGGRNLSWKKVHVPGVDPLTVMDVERGRGQPLTKYDRNMMIFNWLLTLEPEDDTVTPELAATTYQ